MWTLTIAGVLGSYFVTKRYKNSKKAFLLLAGILIVAIMGSRYFINSFTDEITYNYKYQGYKDLSFKNLKKELVKDRDQGFSLFYWALAKMFPWDQFAIYFITAFFVTAAFRFIYYNLEDPLIPVLLIFAFGIFTFYMAAYRQCFSMCFCLFAFEFAKKKKFFPYVLLWLIAVSMHVSAYIFLPVYWLIKLKDKTSWKLWIFIVIGMIIVARGLMEYVEEFYDREDYVTTKEFSRLGFAIQIFIMMIPIILNNFGLCDKKRSNILMWFMIIGLILYLLKLVYFSFERLSYYYTFFTVAVFSQSIHNLRKKDVYDSTVDNVKIVVCLFLILLSFWRMPAGLNFFWNY